MRLVSRKLTYPTKREVWKIIDSNMPFLGGYVSSLEGSLRLLFFCFFFETFCRLTVFLRGFSLEKPMCFFKRQHVVGIFWNWFFKTCPNVQKKTHQKIQNVCLPTVHIDQSLFVFHVIGIALAFHVLLTCTIGPKKSKGHNPKTAEILRNTSRICSWQLRDPSRVTSKAFLSPILTAKTAENEKKLAQKKVEESKHLWLVLKTHLWQPSRWIHHDNFPSKKPSKKPLKRIDA